jgi:hypothetical protein
MVDVEQEGIIGWKEGNSSGFYPYFNTSEG